MGNTLGDTGNSYDFKLIQTINHQIFQQIDILICEIQEYPQIQQYMKIRSSLKNEEQCNFIKRYMKIQNIYKNESIQPFLIYIDENIFEYPTHSLLDEVQIKKNQGLFFQEKELWFLAKSLITGYSLYLQIPELINTQQLSLNNIFITSKGQIKLSLHILFLLNQKKFKNDYIEQSSLSHKITKEIGAILLEVSSLSFEDSIKMMDAHYSQEYCSFVKDLLQDTKSIQYFQNYQISKKLNSTIHLKSTFNNNQSLKVPSQLMSKYQSVSQSQLIEVQQQQSVPTEPNHYNQFDKVSKIASISELNQVEQNQIHFSNFPSPRRFESIHSKQQSLQLANFPIIEKRQDWSLNNMEQFNQRFWNAMSQAKVQIMTFENRNKCIY